jgi:hypothetical protein
MPYFDRFDIVEAHYLFAAEWHTGQWSFLYQELSRILSPDRIDFRPAPGLCFEDMTENGQEIYRELQRRHDFVVEG